MAGFRLKALAKARVADPTTKKMSISPLRGWLAFVGACEDVSSRLIPFPWVANGWYNFWEPRSWFRM